MKRILAMTLLAWASALPLPAGHAPDHRILVNRTKDGLAIQGYDPVAYQTENRPVKGDAHEGSWPWPRTLVGRAAAPPVA
ncbi:MAG: hypothetical protein ACKVYV_02360 [Limisphaerales bacterium]